LTTDPADMVVTERNWGAFFGTDLDLQLRRRGVTQIVLCGIATSIGVKSTACAAHEHGYHVALHPARDGGGLGGDFGLRREDLLRRDPVNLRVGVEAGVSQDGELEVEVGRLDDRDREGVPRHLATDPHSRL
jgi:hypothetical protein